MTAQSNILLTFAQNDLRGVSEEAHDLREILESSGEFFEVIGNLTIFLLKKWNYANTMRIIGCILQPNQQNMDLLKILKRSVGTEFPNLELTSDLFKQTLNYECSNPQLNGVRETVLPCLQQAYAEKEVGLVAPLKLLATELEVYLKKVIWLSEGHLNRVTTGVGDNVYLRGLLSHLRLDNYVNRIRNIHAHNSIELPYDEYYATLKVLVQVYLSATQSRLKPLEKVLYPELNLESYFQSMKTAYEKFQEIFVELNVREQIQIIGKEVISLRDKRPARQGTIAQLRNNNPEKQMMILGQAGMGKTTTLMFLAYQSAMNWLAGREEKTYPVYLTLAAFTQDGDTVEGKIAQRMKREVACVKKWLQAGQITLYLDGFNELLAVVAEVMRRRVQAFIDDYPTVEILIASRPVAYEAIEFFQSATDNKIPIPAFLLMEMNEQLVQTFIQKNYNGDATGVYTLMESQPPLFSLLKTPLYLAEFLHVYHPKQPLPASTTELTQLFLAKKNAREREQNINFDGEVFEAVMAQYVSLSPDPTEQPNPQVAKPVLYRMLEPLVQKTPFSPQSFVQAAVNMHIFVSHRGQPMKYSFAHQSYQDYYLTLFYES